MEIKLSAGDTIQVPAGCKATIKENTIVIEKQEEEFKDGDILHSKNTDRIIIFKSYKTELKDAFRCYYNSIKQTNLYWDTTSFRHATEQEKQAFFDDLKEKGLHWNAETKKMEKVRKRAKKGEKYLYINGIGCVHELKECYDDSDDDENYNLGNYYLLSEREQAEEDAKAIRAIFEKRKKVE